MDTDVGLAVEQSPLDPADEARLVAGFAVGGDLDQLGAAQHLGDLTGLGQGERRAASRESQGQVDLRRCSSVTLDVSPASGSVSTSSPKSSRRTLT